MTRKPRAKSESGFYHVMARGNGRMIIFENESDFASFLKLVRTCFKKYKIELLAWCLMDNHFHFVVRDKNDKLSKAMKELIGSYAQQFNEKYQRSGSVFQPRFRSEPIGTYNYLLEAIRYVLLNPFMAGLASYDTYSWSSYSEYFGWQDICDVDIVRSEFSNKEAFDAYLNEGTKKKQPFTPSYKTLSQEEANKVIHTLLQEYSSPSISTMPKCERDKVLRAAYSSGLSLRQISRCTGLGRKLVTQICRSPEMLRRTDS